MKTTFDRLTRDELIGRIHSLNENSAAQWGKMNVCQMIKHCILWEEMILGKKRYKRAFIGRLIGKAVLKRVLKNEAPIMRNASTIAEFVVTGNGDFSTEKAKWIALLEGHANFPNPGFVHPFFGKMKKEQIGYLAYKHIDHHLRQFNS
jgi:hypothetical protein